MQRVLPALYLALAVPLLQWHAGLFWFVIMGWQGPALSMLMGVAELWAWAETTTARGAARVAVWAGIGVVATTAVAGPAAMESAKPVFERMAQAEAETAAAEARQSAAVKTEGMARAGIEALAADRQSTLDEWQRNDDREQSRETTREGIRMAKELACLQEGLTADCEPRKQEAAWSVETSHIGPYVPLIQAGIYLLAAMLMPVAVTRVVGGGMDSPTRNDQVRAAMRVMEAKTLRGLAATSPLQQAGISAEDLDAYRHHQTGWQSSRRVSKVLDGLSSSAPG